MYQQHYSRMLCAVCQSSTYHASLAVWSQRLSFAGWRWAPCCLCSILLHACMYAFETVPCTCTGMQLYHILGCAIAAITMHAAFPNALCAACHRPICTASCIMYQAHTMHACSCWVPTRALSQTVLCFQVRWATTASATLLASQSHR